MIITNMQADMLPNTWRYISFDNIKNLLLKFKAVPMSDTKNQTGQVALFRRHSSYSMAEREFIDWRKIYTFLLLISTPIPSKDQKREYFERLKENADAETGLITIRKFLKVSHKYIIDVIVLGISMVR